MNELVYIGKTVAPFGIKGEIKVISDFNYIDKAFKVNNLILINNIEHKITNVRKHKQYILLQIDNYTNINDILKYIGFNIYLSKDSLSLKDNEYLLSDLIEAQVINKDIYLGKVIEVINNKVSYLVKVKGDKEFFIPLIDEYIDYFDKNKKILYTHNALGLKEVS